METLIVIAIAIVVLLVLVGIVATKGSGRRGGAPAAPSRGAASPAPLPLGPELDAEIGRLLSSGKKIEAIKVYRNATGVGLAEAKNRVEAWTIGAVPAPAAPTALPTDPASFRTSLPASVVTEIDSLVTAGRPIEAIKLLREHTGFGLAESKRAIDRWAPGAR